MVSSRDEYLPMTWRVRIRGLNDKFGNSLSSATVNPA